VRVVFDTNILVSALVFPGGRADQAMQGVLDGVDELLISPSILAELLGVMARKFSRDAEELARIAVVLSELGTSVSPKDRVEVLQDDPDNRILECALAGRAEAIVTGDRALLALVEWQGVRILTLADFLAA
jgi:uncharacterized protein